VYGWAALGRDAEGTAVVHVTMTEDDADEENHVHRVLTTDPRPAASVDLELDVDVAGRIALRSDGSVLLEDWQATKGRWVVEEVGLFSTVDSMVQHDLPVIRERISICLLYRSRRERGRHAVTACA